MPVIANNDRQSSEAEEPGADDRATLPDQVCHLRRPCTEPLPAREVYALKLTPNYLRITEIGEGGCLRRR